jgi:adenine deaminase
MTHPNLERRIRVARTGAWRSVADGQPFGTLSFLALPVIPELCVTDQGVLDVGRQEFKVLASNAA